MKKETSAAVIRLAEPGDAQSIAEMSRDFIESGLGWRYDTAHIQRAMRRRESVVLVATERQTYVARARPALSGFAVMDFGDERAHLVLLAVQPTRRRNGIGRRLVDWLLESAVVAGMASVHLELRADNEAARRFYRALGFSETVLVPRYYNGREAAMRMLRVLRAPGPLPLSWHPPVLGQK
ncbi:MAG TPA: GNAT family N-acetyltransferase [Burkholderiales bacterium]|nr:GNAT family N-acetyltransferase [Burkholderiales bacterium]